MACKEGSWEVARFLLDRGASTIPTGDVDLTPLFGACCCGRPWMVALLLARGADPTILNSRGQTVLMSASYGLSDRCSDHVWAIRLLLEDGRVPVDARDHGGRTAVWWACLLNNAERAAALVVGGAADFSTVHLHGKPSCAADSGYSQGLHPLA